MKMIGEEIAQTGRGDDKTDLEGGGEGLCGGSG